MFEYIKGFLSHLTPDTAILDVCGIGYKIFIPLSVYSEIIGQTEEITLYLSPVFREDSHRLFGFLSRSQRDLFEKVCDVSGIGPKIALSLIGHMQEQQLYLAIHHQDVKSLSKVPGLGKKTAERLIVEMKDKCKTLQLKEPMALDSLSAKNSLMEDALAALVNLGYQRASAYNAIEKVLKEQEKAPDLPELITSALKQI